MDCKHETQVDHRLAVLPLAQLEDTALCLCWVLCFQCVSLVPGGGKGAMHCDRDEDYCTASCAFHFNDVQINSLTADFFPLLGRHCWKAFDVFLEKFSFISFVLLMLNFIIFFVVWAWTRLRKTIAAGKVTHLPLIIGKKGTRVLT